MSERLSDRVQMQRAFNRAASERAELLEYSRGERDSVTFAVKDSGQRQEFESGMVRDTTEGKPEWWRLRIGPMPLRWVQHVSKAATKYPDVAPGTPNWTLAEGEEEYYRFLDSADRHFAIYMTYALTGVNIEDPENPTREPLTEDHAAAVMFNINGAEYVRQKLEEKKVA